MESNLSHIYDPLRYQTIEYLSVEDILNLCKTRKEYREICKDKETWDYLLERDLHLKSDEPRETYIEAYKISPKKLEEFVKNNLVEKLLQEFARFAPKNEIDWELSIINDFHLVKTDTLIYSVHGGRVLHSYFRGRIIQQWRNTESYGLFTRFEKEFNHLLSNYTPHYEVEIYNRSAPYSIDVSIDLIPITNFGKLLFDRI